jgi:integrase
LTPAIENFRDDLLKKGSRAMARKVLASLKSILGEAQRRGLVAQNAAQPVKVDLKKRDKGKLAIGRDIPSEDEINIILAKAEGRWRPLFVTAIFTGMRASELRGLIWDDLDFGRNVIHVRQRADDWGVIGAPKSAAGTREIPMAPMVVNTLREWRLACPRSGAGEGDGGSLWLVFPNGAGKIENHANIANRGFYALQLAAGMVDAAGKPKYGFHALRHFFASWAIEQGFSPKRVQALLGHSSIGMTFDVYGHLFPSLEDDHAKFAAGELALVR